MKRCYFCGNYSMDGTVICPNCGRYSLYELAVDKSETNLVCDKIFKECKKFYNDSIFFGKYELIEKSVRE